MNEIRLERECKEVGAQMQRMEGELGSLNVRYESTLRKYESRDVLMQGSRLTSCRKRKGYSEADCIVIILNI